MDETSLLLPPRSSSNLSTQPDQLCAADSGAGPSRVLEVAAPPRPHGLREIANLSRNSIPGSSVLLSPSWSSSRRHIIILSSFVSKLNLQSSSPTSSKTRSKPLPFPSLRGSVRASSPSPPSHSCWHLLPASTGSFRIATKVSHVSLFAAYYRVDSAARRLDCLGYVRFPSVHRRKEFHRSLHPLPALRTNVVVALHPHRHNVGEHGTYPDGPRSRRGAQSVYPTILARTTPSRTWLHRLRKLEEILTVSRYGARQVYYLLCSVNMPLTPHIVSRQGSWTRQLTCSSL
jgi:hypothetical protein